MIQNQMAQTERSTGGLSGVEGRSLPEIGNERLCKKQKKLFIHRPLQISTGNGARKGKKPKTAWKAKNACRILVEKLFEKP
jgi:hypothetical protein